MKVGDRKQQGRTVNGKQCTPREICPACKTHYLNPYRVYDNSTKRWVKKGKVCPNKLCTFSRKD
ncbi:MAG: hypothetical protein PHG79_13245 [Methanosarcina sp.]|nr:hypothetical protein [Methanosarcina sp.]